MLEKSTKSSLLPTRTIGLRCSLSFSDLMVGSQYEVIRFNVSSLSSEYTMHITCDLCISALKVSSAPPSIKSAAQKSTILVGTFSGVTSAGIVISSAFGGTSSENSSLTKLSIKDL